MLALFGYGMGLVFVGSSVLLNCHRKPKADFPKKISGNPQDKGYKPGHLPEFADPDEKTTDTFYGIKSGIAFPAKNPDGTPVVPEPPKSGHLAPGDSMLQKSISAAAVPVPKHRQM